MKLYKHKTSARAAAIKALGKGGEFEIVATDDGQFYWIDTSEAAAEAAGAENDPSPVYVAPEPEVALLEAPEPFHEPEEKADLTVDLGITPELAALIYGLGEAAGAAIPVPQKRKGITADAWAAVERGEMPAPLVFPNSNKHAQKHADAMRALTEAGDRTALEEYQIGGTNTYSKALRSYREALISYLDNNPAPEMKEAA